MSLIVQDSLGETIDAASEALFFGETIEPTERLDVARWIAGRHALPGSYGQMFAPTERDYRQGVRLFSGERIDSGAGTGHVLGEESCRLLYALNVDDNKVRDTLAEASDGFLSRLEPANGWFCCGRCSVALWRHLAAKDLSDIRLASGVRALRDLRVGDATWRRAPFHYTVLALTEAGSKEALDELKYAAPRLEKLARSKAGARSPHAPRHKEIALRALEKI